MILINDVESMISERPVCQLTAKNYLRTIRYFGEFLGRIAKRQDLFEKQVNRFLAHVAANKSTSTTRGHRASLTTLWNWLAEQNLVRAYDPRRLRIVRLEVEPPCAFSLTQVRQLLAAAELVEHPCNHGTASEMLRAWILLAYESGLRPSDLRRLKPVHFATETITIRQHKTGKPHSFTISESTRAALKPLIDAGNPTIFPDSKFAIDRWGKRLMAQAEAMGFTRRVRQGLGTIRKTHATEVCRQHGLESAAQSLGHVSGTMIVRRYYVEPSAISTAPPPPPLID